MTSDDCRSPACGEAGGPLAIERLNAECFCVALDEAALALALQAQLGAPELVAMLRERCPTMFAAHPVFVSPSHLARMAALVQAIDAVVHSSAWQNAVLEGAPAVARQDPGARGAFLGFDFHVAGDAFGLIEINTNAGGAMLNAVLARAQRACCPAVARLGVDAATADAFEAAIVAMFRAEWRLGTGGDAPLRRIAIVDETPEAHFRYPEFLLFRQLFERHGIRAVIADPRALSLRHGRLVHEGEAVDLDYNRLTDFALDAPSSAALRSACLGRAAVVTPHPRAHALYADKRNLARLTDPAMLAALGVPPATQAVLQNGIPHTEVVDPSNAARLWQERRRLFFKPFAGFGSRAAYRGDKLTRRTWEEIRAGGYVAQALVAPGERTVSAVDLAQVLKFDLRDYVYDGVVQWTAARLYRGQTTNFRTPGGGFAPVFSGCC
jgi:hypothetical protein